MATLVILMYVLTGTAVALIVLSSCATTVAKMDNRIDQLWLVLRYVLGWPVMLYKAFHKGELGLV